MKNHPQNKFCCISRKRRSSGRRQKLEDFFWSTHSVRLSWKHKRGGGEGNYNEPEDLMNYPSYPLVFLQFTSKRSNTKDYYHNDPFWTSFSSIHNPTLVMVVWTTIYLHFDVRLTSFQKLYSQTTLSTYSLPNTLKLLSLSLASLRNCLPNRIVVCI